MSGNHVSGWLEFFLTPTEKDRFAEWREVVNDRSVINPVFSSVFEWVAQFVPENVAPNVVTLAGTFAILQAWYFCRTYSDSDHAVVSAVSIVSIGVFWCCGGIDGKHARRTWNDTSMGELFKYSCDVISSVFLVIVLTDLLLEKNESLLDDQWYCVQTVQIVFFSKHYSAFNREASLRYFLIGPGELVSWAAGLLCITFFLGSGWLKVLHTYVWGSIYELLQQFDYSAYARQLPDSVADSISSAAVRHKDKMDSGMSYLATMSPARAIYIIVFAGAFFRIAFSRRLRYRHAWTYWCLLSILGLRAASASLARFFLRDMRLSERDVIFDGLFMALVTSDLVVAKMAGRELHSVVVIMASMVVLPHMQFLVTCFIIFYYISVFGDLMNHMNLPLMICCRNVYCDGIYDLCHVGHKNLFRRALKNGNRLFVGVVGDKDANAYKRPPIMTASERESEVASCKCVTKVIPNAPCFGLTEEFIRKHRIHVVAFGKEYEDRYPNPDDDPYYKVPRKLGLGMPMPRTSDISTSELISRIQNRPTDAKKTPGT